ncbi:MAG: molybdopterin molybdotransferase MoeA [Chloroflexi bacterium]|nr:molybdopterin molybdotransferase MoeA [Chloroflexota bacterium]
MAMLSLEEAYEQILSAFHPLEPESRPLLDALGQVLAEDIVSPFDVPPLPNSAMDGYAVRYEDVRGATPGAPRPLRVLGYVAAGHIATDAVVAGTAMRIMTGAPMPAGADTVVPFEETDEVERRQRGLPPEGITEIGIQRAGSPGANARAAGEDIRAGEVVLRAGVELRPAEIGVLASLGYTQARVIRRPVVALLATGDELVAPGEELGPGQIYDSNSFSAAAQVLRYGGVPLPLGIARDTVEALTAKIEEGLQRADLLLTSAGVSLGDFDLVKDVLARLGEITLWSVRIRPGKPLAFGTLVGKGMGGQLRRVPHLGLPGNPVSSMVTFELYARPALMKMMGRRVTEHPTIDVELGEDVENHGGRRFFARASVRREGGRFVARLTGPQGSGVLTSMALANALVVIPEDVELAAKGGVYSAQMLDWSTDL